jgi:tetratricopeptide (TPR) repeat protein
MPLGQSLFHVYHVYNSLISLPVIASLTLHISLFITAAALFRKSGRNLLSDNRLHGVLQRLASLGIVWFYIAMSVESSIFPITDKIFEHRIYLPSVGFFLTISAGIALAAHGKRVGYKAAWSLLLSACLVLGGLTIARNQVWSNTFALWQDTVRKAPNKDLALANLAGEYMKLDMPDKALPLFVRALELNQVFMTATKVHLGLTLQRLKIDGSRFTTGEEILSIREHTGKVLDRNEQNRLQTIMYNNLGLAYEYMGKPVDAIEPYNAALRINPAYDLAWYNLGLLSIRLGDRKQFNKALDQLKKLNPSLAGSLETAMKK